jgi:hypothetical protein
MYLKIPQYHPFHGFKSQTNQNFSYFFQSYPIPLIGITLAEARSSYGRMPEPDIPVAVISPNRNNTLDLQQHKDQGD